MNIIPEDVFFNHVIPYLATSNDLKNMKQVNKYFQKNIYCHDPWYCYNCGEKIEGSQNCEVSKCMVIGNHVDVKYYTVTDDPLCSLSCAIAICDGLIY